MLDSLVHVVEGMPSLFYYFHPAICLHNVATQSNIITVNTTWI